MSVLGKKGRIYDIATDTDMYNKILHLVAFLK